MYYTNASIILRKILLLAEGTLLIYVMKGRKPLCYSVAVGIFIFVIPDLTLVTITYHKDFAVCRGEGRIVDIVGDFGNSTLPACFLLTGEGKGQKQDSDEFLHIDGLNIPPRPDRSQSDETL